MKQREHYSPEQLEAFLVADLLADAEHAEKQASTGPYYPDKGITRASLLAYAAKCRGAVLKLQVPSGRTDDWGQEGICVPS